MAAPWGPLTPGTHTSTTWQIGRCRFWARSTEDEWEIASRYAADDDEVVDEAEDDLSWTRFVTVANDQLNVVPALPDRPVVVRPASPIVILPERWGRFFFRVPLWARFISQPGGTQTTMEEIPTRRPPSIWFGSIASGELCYALEAPLERRLEEVSLSEAYAACEVIVRNTSRERLRFERICVHVENMRLFRAEDRLWTNEVRVAFRGAEHTSQLTFLPLPPETAGQAVVVSEPRIPPEAGIIKRSFALIREITGM